MKTRKLTFEEYQISTTNPSGQTLPSEPSHRLQPSFKSLKSLIKPGPSFQTQPQNQRNSIRKQSHTIYSKGSSKSVIPPMNEPVIFTRSLTKHKTKSINLNNQEDYYPLTTSIQSSNIMHPIRTSSKNVINFSDRRKIREMSINRQSVRTKTLNEMHQSNKMIISDYNTIEAVTDHIPPSRNLFDAKRLKLLCEFTGESNSSSNSSNTFRSNKTNKRRRNANNQVELRKLITLNPFDKLRYNFDYRNNIDQLKYMEQANPQLPLFPHKYHQRNNSEMIYQSKGIDNETIKVKINSKNKDKGKDALIKQYKQSCIYICNEQAKPNLIKRLLERKQSLLPEVKNLIFLQGIIWLWSEYSIQIEQLFFCYKDFKWYLEKHKYINKKGIEELMSLIKLSKPIDFTNSLFLSFGFIDHDKQEKVNFNIIITILILTSSAISYQEKMERTLDVWENSTTHKVKLTEIIEVVQMTFRKKKDIKKLIDLLKSIYCIENWEKAEIDNKNLLNLIVNDIRLANIIRRNKINLEKNGEQFEDEIQNIFYINLKNSKRDTGAYPEGVKRCQREMYHYEKILDNLVQCNFNREFLKNQRIEDGLDESI